MSDSRSSRKDRLEAVAENLRRGQLTCSHPPIEWFFEISKHCNIRCLTCGRVYDERFKESCYAGNMSPRILEKVESHLDDGFVVHSVGFGEPFMNRHAVDFFRTIKKHGPYLDVITNGTLLKGKAEALIESGLDTLIVSMDGGTPEVFEHFRAGAKWDTVVQSLEELRDLKKAKGATKPEVWIEFVAMRGNLPTFPRLVELAATEWDCKGVSVEPLYQMGQKGYIEFYLEQNLSSVPFSEVEACFSEAKELAGRHGLVLGGPYFEGDMLGIWEQARFRSIAYIDYPQPGEGVDGRSPFQGWAIHPSGVEKVTFRIGTGPEREAGYGQSRPDVCKLSHDFPDEEHSGFVIPVEPSWFEEGENTLHVTVTDKAGGTTELPGVTFRYDPASGAEVPPPRIPETRVRLKVPNRGALLDDTALVAGWFLPPVPRGLKVYLDDRVAGEAMVGLEHPEIVEALGDPEAARSGFCQALDLTDFDEGPSTLRIESIPAAGEAVESLEVPVTLKRGSSRERKVAARAEGSIQLPAAGETISESKPFIGWSVYGPTVQRFRLLCDGQEAGSFCHDLPRTDIQARFSQAALSDRLGFAVLVDTLALADGDHTFSLAALNEDGTETILSEIVCTVRNGRDERDTAVGDDSRKGPSRVEREKFLEKKDLLFKDPSRKTQFSPFCSMPWTTIYIAFDGTVRPCCFSEPLENLGDLTKQTFEEIWNGEAYQRLRWKILNSMIPKICEGCMANTRVHGRAIFDKFRQFL